MSERITIAIPFHRNLAYLESAVQSVQAQDRSDWSLLVCDDGERDQGAREYLASLADDRIHYHRNERNLGMVACWNRCLELARTDLVSLLHADDRLEPHYASLVVGLADDWPDAAALCCEASIIGADGAPRFSLADRVKSWLVPGGGDPLVLAGESALRALMRGNFIMCPTLCFRKPRLGDRRFSPAWSQVQDLALTARLLMEGESIVYARRVAYTYRRHAENTTELQSRSLLRFEEEFRLFEEIAERADSLGWRRAARVSRRKTILRLHLGYRALAELAALRPGQATSYLGYLARRR